MNLVRHSLASCGLLALSCAPVCAVPVLIGEFALQGSLNNNVSGGPPLVALPFSSVFGQITSTGYVFGANQGLTFTSPTLSSGSYSIELSFKSNLDSAANWSKLVDFAGQTLDAGLYIHSNGGYRLQFYNVVEGPSGDFAAGTNVAVVLTRTSGGTVAGYVNGLLRFSFADTSNQALITAANSTLNFFVDDHVQGDEASSGTVNFIRIYDDALSASDVSALFLAGAPSAIPEPATGAAILGAYALGLAALRRRRAGR